ncbi:ER membrane protein [Mactra antiquata]
MSNYDNNIPWNKKPKNGNDAYFSEAVYCQWVDKETHESHLSDRLGHLNVTLSSKPPSCPYFISSPVASAKQSKSNVSATSSHCSTIRETVATTTLQNKDKVDLLAQKLWSEVTEISPKNVKYGSDEISESRCMSEENNLTLAHTNIDNVNHDSKTESNKDLFKVSHVTDTTDNGLEVEKTYITPNTFISMEQNRKLSCEQSDDLHTAVDSNIDDECNKVANDDHDESKTDISDSMVTQVKPGFFYKDSDQVGDDDKDESEDVKEVDSADAGSTVTDIYPSQSTVKSITSEVNNETNDTQKEGQGGETESTNSGKRRFMDLDPMFYNIKDRKAEKYFADIFKKKPRNRYSDFTAHEQRVYIELHQMYNKTIPTEQDLADENYHKYLKMSEKVSKEQQLFQKYLRSISFTCLKDYQYIHPEVEKYVTARFLKKRKDVFTYPRYYEFTEKFELTDDLPVAPPMLQYIQPLVKLGHVSKLVLPSILPGLPQPCVTMNCKKINEISPVVPKIYQGTYVWNNMVCSRDSNAEQLAVPNKCDIVMSSSSVKHLVDNQGTSCKYWDMPFTVREYSIIEGDTQSRHKVVYIDKAIVRQSQYVPRERIQIYQKHAIRASSMRKKQRGHMFCGIKPVHEVIASHDINDVKTEVKTYEEKLKDSIEKTGLPTDIGENLSQKDTRKRRRRGAGQKSQGGMFETDDNIDDLETFGMDSLVGLKSKEGNPAELSKTKGGKSDDLEILKQELSGIKSRAIKESIQSNEKVGCKMNTCEDTDVENRDSKNNDDDDNQKNSNISLNDDEILEIPDSNCDENKSESSQDKKLPWMSEKINLLSTIENKLKEKTKNSSLSKKVVPQNGANNDDQKFEDLAVIKDLRDITHEAVGDSYSLYEPDIVSDSDDEALIIDLPNDDLKVTSKREKDTSNLKIDTCCNILDEDNSSKTFKLSSDKQNDDTEIEQVMPAEPPKLELQVSKRKRQSVSKLSVEVSSPKRSLRSSTNRDNSPKSLCSRVTRSRTQNVESIMSSGTSDTTESSISHSIGKSDKKTAIVDRVTRSRSVSSENVNIHGGYKTNPRTLKRSSTSALDQSGVDCEKETNNLQEKSILNQKKKKTEERDSLDELKDRKSTKSINTRNVKQVNEDDAEDDNVQCIESAKVKSGLKGSKNDLKMKKNKQVIGLDLETKKIKEMAVAMRVKMKELSGKNKDFAEDNSQSVTDSAMEKKDESLTTVSKTDMKGSNELSIKSSKNSVTTSTVKSLWNREDNSGIGNLLGTPASTNKKSLAETYAAQHGMTYCGYPVDGNVTYHQWSLSNINILIRCKYHGFISGQGLVHLCPKTEYQPNFGYEVDTLNEITRNWISVYTRPNSSLLKARINPFNSEIMMLEYIPYQDLIPANSEFSQAQAFTDLHFILDRLKSLPVGEYILRNNPKKDRYTIMKSTDENTRGKYDLHHQHSSLIKTESPNSIQWTPIDVNLMLPHHRKSNLIPCTYQPKDVKPGQSVNNKGKKKKGGKRGKQGKNNNSK